MAKATTSVKSASKTARKSTSTKATATKAAKPKATAKVSVKEAAIKPKRASAKTATPKATAAKAAPASATKIKATKAKATSNADLMAIAKASISSTVKPKAAWAKPTRSRAESNDEGVATRAKATAKAFAATRVNALAAAQFAIEKKAENVRLLELKDVTSITDFFVVCSADTDRQVKAIAENVIVEMRDNLGQQPWRSEGWDTLRWVIIDFVDFVVHVLQSESRLYYNIERLWADAPSELIEDNTVKPKRTSKKKAAADAEPVAPKEKKSRIRVIKDLDSE